MISHCPHCARPVPVGEPLRMTRLGWMPTACMNGDGPLPMWEGRMETVSNHPCWYVSVVDGTRKGLLTGPFASYDEARANIRQAKKLAERADPKACWYAYGVASSHEPKKTVFGMGEEVEPAPVQPKRRKRKAGAA